MKRALPLLIAFALFPAAAQAWSHKAHAAIAEIAAANLTPAAQAQVQWLLKDDLAADGNLSGRTTLASVSSWPDEIRELAEKGTYSGWHTRANPVCSDTLGPCKDGHCVDQLIIDQATILKDKTRPVRERNEALKWVVHLTGDLHTPLHSGSNNDASGNLRVVMEGLNPSKKATLHSVWDAELSHLALKTGGAIKPKLQASPHLAADAPTQWMLETREVARKHVYDPLPGFACGTKAPQPITLDENYRQQAIAPIRSQIAKAGLRLAQLLNETLE